MRGTTLALIIVALGSIGNGMVSVMLCLDGSGVALGVRGTDLGGSGVLAVGGVEGGGTEDVEGL